MHKPQLIILISGKRKSGKDYLSEKLCETLTNEKCIIVRISEPIKSTYAQVHKLDLKQLMSDGSYKEKYRLDMIKWSEEVRNEDYGYFCKIACGNAQPKPVWIVSDIRRKSDLRWFNENYVGIIKTVRVNTDIQVRKERGWIFTEGVDDAESECNLDDVHTWDFVISNNNSSEALTALTQLNEFIVRTLL